MGVSEGQYRHMFSRNALTKCTLTDTERAAAARGHWDLHHMTWSPKILGQYNTHNAQVDQTIMITPTKADRMFEYFNLFSISYVLI